MSGTDYQPLDVPSVRLQIVSDRAGIEPPLAPAQITLRSDPNRVGWYKGQFVPPQSAPVPARYVASIRLPGAPGAEDVILTHEVEVRESDREIRRAMSKRP